MAIYNSDFMVDIATKAPWLLEDKTSIFPQEIKGNIRQTINDITDSNLTIITDTDQVYRNELLLQVVNNQLQMEKPPEWDDSAESFHLFFRNKNRSWNFFQARKAISYPTTLTTDLPEKIYYFQKRRHKRSPVPIGTKAIFRNDRDLMDTAYVRDISEGGMLICAWTVSDRYNIDSVLHNIFITVPPDEKKDIPEQSRRIMPLINLGRIVHHSHESEHNFSMYGVSFLIESDYVKDSLRGLVEEFQERPGISVFSPHNN